MNDSTGIAFGKSTIAKLTLQDILEIAAKKSLKISDLNKQFAMDEFFNLPGTCFRDADFRGIGLYGVVLDNCVFVNCDFRGADLRNASFRDCTFSNTNFSNADMRWADFEGASIDFACIGFNSSTRIYGANLAKMRQLPRGFENVYPTACPRKGRFIAYKSVCYRDTDHYLIAKLEVPSEAYRSSATTDKCRASKAFVIGFYDPRDSDREIEPYGNDKERVFSYNDPTFHYYKDSWVEIEDFDHDRFNECAPGIHFYMSFRKAVKDIKAR